MNSSRAFLLLSVAAMGISSGGSTNVLLGHEHGSSLSGSHSPLGCLTDGLVFTSLFRQYSELDVWSSSGLSLADFVSSSTTSWSSTLAAFSRARPRYTANDLPVKALSLGSRNSPTKGMTGTGLSGRKPERNRNSGSG